MVFSLAAKPGTIRRTFGGGDDDDDEDEEDEEAIVSATPKRSLGAGLLWSAALGLGASALVVLLREPIADVLLGDASYADVVLWAGVAGWLRRAVQARLDLPVVRAPALGVPDRRDRPAR